MCRALLALITRRSMTNLSYAFGRAIGRKTIFLYTYDGNEVDFLCVECRPSFCKDDYWFYSTWDALS